MDDAELNAIRAARLAELQKNAAGGSGSAPSSSAPTGNAGSSAGTDDVANTILARVLDTHARERLNRVKMVRPDRAQAVEQYILKLYSMGQLQRKLGEDEVVEILDGISRDSSQKAQTKITYNRKHVDDDDDDDDFFD
ncbi:uncharacterized protein SPAPADRAFT_59393 [Spathaspora passalidarum NRRL Y-27907]|uniref:DNA-binding TFAR19-related protein n=1 Tax=Spathaspora passalidarum (strain NRRL Y-27907 / 11-Y1) TaxID=619300 RepID=G3AJT3_SPAPN|nr:uncharacterized protein SPAPADRAFT_59393 [Spathaspora passalidarum NRRL Y-27907]EGW33984.1 hypothetical protein SPAPADRAFT_59393 [Spathaspora passalidarum NRRL Y-27907]